MPNDQARSATRPNQAHGVTASNRQPYAPLVGRRVTLRPFLAADVATVKALAGDWQVARTLADMPHPLSIEHAVSWLRRAPDEHSYAITMDRAMIGAVTLFAASAQPAPARSAELGFWIGRPWWGRGFASEAAVCVLDCGFGAEHSAFTSVTSGHFADNLGSAKILSRLGFSKSGEKHQWCVARGCHVPAHLYELTRPTWIARSAQARLHNCAER